MSERGFAEGGTSHQSGQGTFAQASGGGTAILTVYQAAKPEPVDPAAIAAAEARFAELPLDGPPEPGDLPPLHAMPYRRNRTFTGRAPDLRALARQIKQGGTAAVGQSPAVTGLGGQGKTQLAVEFAYRYGRWFPGGVFFVNCADPVAMAEAIAACGLALANDPGFSGRPLPERVALVGAAWASPLPRLLIFDNCEDEGLIDDWAPKCGGCRLQITARPPSLSPARGVTVLPLGRLTPDEGLALLRRHRPDVSPDDPDLRGIAEELGDLPLALELAGRYLTRYQHEAIGAPSAYLAELRGADLLAHASLTIADPDSGAASRRLTGHERDVARTFEVSLRRLDADAPTDALARHLLACAAWLAPGLPIPPDLLRHCAGHTDDDKAATRLFADALARLLDLALVERVEDGGGALVLHRLVAAFARTRLDQDASIRDRVEEAVARLAKRFLPANDPTPFRGWAGHLLALASTAGRDGTNAAIGLLHTAGYYSLLVADFGSATTMLEDAADRAESLHGPNHPEVARTLGDLGLVQRERGDLDGALRSLTRALTIKEAAYGPDHPEVAQTLGNLGSVQRKRGDLDGALRSQRRVLTIEEAVYRPNHPEVARTLGNLGLVQRERGDLDVALRSLTRALAIFETAYGPVHPDVARTLSNLGNVQRDLDQVGPARVLYGRAVAIFSSGLGDDHPDTIRARRLLGELEHSTEKRKPWWKRLWRR